MKPWFVLFVAALGAVSLTIPSCGKGAADPTVVSRTTTASSSKFDADRAWKYLERQVEFGPRASGSNKIEELRAWMTEELRTAGYQVVREEFTKPTIVGERFFCNLYVDLPPTLPVEGKPDMVIVGTHFDTKAGLPFKFVGANDGASSTAVALELAHALKAKDAPKRDYTLRLLFLDGEEAIGPQWNPSGSNNTYGSQYHVQKLVDLQEIKRVRAFLLMDMVGDADLKLTRDSRSDRRLLQLSIETATELGLAKYVNGATKEILDDHIPFMNAGVPSVDLIDAEYGPKVLQHTMGGYWHTEGDVAANCSKESLEVVGRIVLGMLPKLNRTPAKPK